MNYKEVFWEAPEKNTNSKLSALQFAAKAHELLIFASLSAIILHALQHSLAKESRGIPLGLLNASYQINSTLYLFSAEFWKIFAINSFTKTQVVATVAILLPLSLAPVVGPASAVTMIPKLSWWHLPSQHSWNIFVGTEAVSDNGDFDFEIAPETVTKIYDIAHSVTFEILSSVFDSRPFPLGGHNETSANITLPVDLSNLQRKVHTESLPASSESHGCHISYTLPAVFATTIASMLQIIQTTSRSLKDVKRLKLSQHFGPDLRTEESKILKPLALIECASTNAVNESSSLILPHDDLPFDLMESGKDAHAQWHVPSEAWEALWSRPPDYLNDTMENTSVASQWLDFSGLEDKPRPSLGALWYSRVLDSPGNFHLCTIDARWMPSHIWIDLSNDEIVHDDAVIDRTTIRKTLQQTAYKPIYISKDWVELPRVPSSESLESVSTLTGFWAKCAYPILGEATSDIFSQDYVPPRMTQCISSVVATYLAESLANLAALNPIVQHLTFKPGQNPVTSQPSSNITADLTLTMMAGIDNIADLNTSVNLKDPHFHQLFFTYEQYGYGYGFRGALVYLGVAVLILHIILVIFHIGITQLHGWSSGAWKHMTDMTVLAWNSTPTARLSGSSLGVKDKSLWRRGVRVVAKGERGLELVLDDTVGALGSDGGDFVGTATGGSSARPRGRYARLGRGVDEEHRVNPRAETV